MANANLTLTVKALKKWYFWPLFWVFKSYLVVYTCFHTEKQIENAIKKFANYIFLKSVKVEVVK